MTPEAQQIAIAEACGWKSVVPHGQRHTWWFPPGVDAEQKARYGLPDFLNDLNAMHEAEEVLDGRQWEEYVQRLIDLVRASQGHKWKIRNVVCVHATAAQRAEAFLKTLGLWEEETPDDDSPDCDFDPYGRDVMDRINDIADKNDRI